MEHKEISIKWSTIDVIDKAKDMEEDLTIYEATIILDKIEHHHDASIGVNWDTIAFYIQDYLDSFENESMVKIKR